MVNKLHEFTRQVSFRPGFITDPVKAEKDIRTALTEGKKLRDDVERRLQPLLDQIENTSDATALTTLREQLVDLLFDLDRKASDGIEDGHYAVYQDDIS